MKGQERRGSVLPHFLDRGPLVIMIHKRRGSKIKSWQEEYAELNVNM